MPRTTHGFFAAAILMVSATASAQAAAPAPVRTRGTIVSIAGDDAVIRTAMGRVTAHLAADTRIAGVKRASLDDIKPDSFIGTAAVPAEGGQLRALEVTVFPEAMRGTGEGSYPWDLGKSGSMTNGAVSSMTNGTVSAAGGTHGRTIKVSYKGGAQIVNLPDDIPVVRLEPGDRSLLRPGAKVVVFGPSEGGQVLAKRLVVGEDGIKPPM